MPRVLVLYHSAYGHIETLAEAVAEGAREAGAQVDIKRVPETVPRGDRQGGAFQARPKAPIAKVDELADYDAIIVGVGTRFGRMASQMAAFLDQAGGLWAKGALHGKVGGAFTSTATQHGGQETTPVLGHHQSAAFRHGDRRPELRPCRPDRRWTRSPAASPYGASTIAGGEGQRQPSKNELAGARYQGRKIAETAKKLAA